MIVTDNTYIYVNNSYKTEIRICADSKHAERLAKSSGGTVYRVELAELLKGVIEGIIDTAFIADIKEISWEGK